MSLEARDITFRYPRRGSGPVLEGVSLTLAPGERLGLFAPSGRGKTTLCKLLAGYERPGRGEVLLDTYSLRDLAPAVRTDGTDWLVTEEDGSETYCPVLEPRMAALYRLGLERYCPDLLPPEEGD